MSSSTDFRENPTNAESPAPGTGLLIDFSDEEKIPFPQQLLTNAEIDDTFGLFKPRSASDPVFAHQPCSDNVFSPLPLQNIRNYSDSVFEPSKSSRRGNNTASRSGIGSSNNMTVSSNQDSSSMSSAAAGVNEGFMGSSSSKLDSSVATTLSSVVGTSSPDGRNETGVTDKENSPAGIMEAKMGDDSQLLDLSAFTISSSSSGKSNNTSPKKVMKNKGWASEKGEELSIFDSVLRRQSLKKQKNESIAKQVQQLFDNASPTKNPQLYEEINRFRSYTPGARSRPSIAEAFCYGTPRRVAFSQSPAVSKDLTSVSFSESPVQRIRPLTFDSESEPQSDGKIAHVIPTPKRGDAKDGSSFKEPLIPSRTHTPVRTRLSFSSTSSESSAEPSFGETKKALKMAVVQPRVQPKIQIHTKPKRPGLTEHGKDKELQPLKAVHLEPPGGKSKHSSNPTASAPVYRKFPAPVATSSPIVTSKVYQPSTPTAARQGRTSLATPIRGSRLSLSPAPRDRTAYSRIPASPLSKQSQPPTAPQPKRRALVSGHAGDERLANNHGLSSADKGATSRETAPPNVERKVNHSTQRSQTLAKETAMRLKRFGITK